MSDTLLEFITTVPPTVTALLIDFAPYISHARRFTQVLNWQSSNGAVDSWLVLGAWWGVCLLFRPFFRHALPLMLLVPFLPFLKRSLPKNQASIPKERTSITTEKTLSAVADLTVIQTFLPKPLNLPSLPSFSQKVSIRLLIAIYPPYLAITHFVPLRTLVAIAGTLVIIHNAPWAIALRQTIAKSGWVRRFSIQLWHAVTGEPLPVVILPQITSEPANSHRFLFTLLENQRWWMGLDWTAALLPHERPSWSAANSNFSPLPPPSSFSLPPTTTVFLKNPQGGRIKRVARWQWIDGEWGVVVRKEGEPVTRSVLPPPPPPAAGSTSAPGEPESTSSRLSRVVAAKLGNSTASTSASETVGSPTTERREPSFDGQPQPEGDEFTDSDGWCYGDNKWENQSSKGGIGKYTRFRRWTRMAILTETIEQVDDGEVGILKEDTGTIVPFSEKIERKLSSDHEQIPLEPLEKRRPEMAEPNLEPVRHDAPQQDDGDDGNRLRRRLKAVVTGQGNLFH